ncbi:DUF2878 domain-containing protein [Pelagibacteraceae bacterium]|nr:DUF2878 domain-containing protein [Pelagibacteraceae bacterium]
MSKIKVFFTLTGYQLTWLACVFGENKYSNPYLGIFVGIFFLALYFYINQNKYKFLKLSLLISIPGYFFDTLMVYSNIYQFNSAINFLYLPYWMIILWLSFSTLFDEILIFLKRYKILAILLSAILGPFTYYLGEPIGVISINNINLFFIFMTLFWVLLMIYYLEIVLKKI